MKKICVIIPIHKNRIEGIELEGLKNNLEKLNRYDNILACPESMETSFYEKLGITKIEKFNDRWFKDIYSYNRLCVSKEFYKRFSDYEYMLMCHVDAYVFSDQLEKWCDKGYDYIGAPWMTHMYWNDYGDIIYHVGNGGFSLRKINSFIKFTTDEEDFLMKANDKHIPEDLLFAYYKNFKIPPYEEAVYFSWETEPELCYKISNGIIPFGSHRLNHFSESYFNLFKKKDDTKDNTL